MQTIKKIWKWVVLSSADANKLSLTVKGVLMSILPVLLYLMPIFNIQTSHDTLATVINDIGTFIVVFGGAISAGVTAYGLLRKIGTTLTGNNDVINNL